MPQDLAALRLDDSDTEAAAASVRKTASQPSTGNHFSQHTPSRSAREDNAARDNALRAELDKVRGVNQVVQKVIDSLEKSRTNMNTVHASVQSASSLLDTWTKILAQTEHNQRMLLHPDWKGASHDAEEFENEATLRQQAAERKAAEEEARREAALRAAEEEERKRAASSSVRGTRARGRGISSTTRGTSTRGASASASSSTRQPSSSSRAGSGIGRGISSTRGRARGV